MRIRGQIPDHVLKLMHPKDKPKGPSGKTSEELIMDREIKSERDLQEQIAQYLTMKDIAFDRDRMDKRRTGTKGWPDFTFAWYGTPVAIECKAPDGKLTLEQELLHGKLWHNGWTVKVVTSLQEVVDLLKHLRESRKESL